MTDEESQELTKLADYCNYVAQLSFKKRNLVISTSVEGVKAVDEAVIVERKLRKRIKKRYN